MAKNAANWRIPFTLAINARSQLFIRECERGYKGLKEKSFPIKYSPIHYSILTKWALSKEMATFEDTQWQILNLTCQY